MNETIIFNKKIISKNGLYFSDFLFLLNFILYEVVQEVNYKSLEEQDLVYKTEYGYSITDYGKALIENIIGQSIREKEFDDEVSSLADVLFNMYPSGLKPDTNKYWRGSKEEVKFRLTIFMRKYGLYDTELIIRATEKYLDSFEDDITLMRTLPYFIYKDGSSDLLTVIDNINDEWFLHKKMGVCSDYNTPIYLLKKI